MKALTVLQPWAWAIAAGHKRIENRTWATSYRGPLVIHAGRDHRLMAPGIQFLRGVGIERPLLDGLPFGAIVALAELVNCVRYDDQTTALHDDPFAEGPVCWVLDNVVEVEPVPYRGAQGLFDVPDDVVDRLRRVAMAREGAYEIG